MPDQVKTTSKKIMIGSEDKLRPSSLHFRGVNNSQRMFSTICTTFQFQSEPPCFRMLHLSSVLASKRFESNSHAVAPLKGRRYPTECSTVHLCAEYVKTDLVISEKRNMDCKKKHLMMSSIKDTKTCEFKERFMSFA